MLIDLAHLRLVDSIHWQASLRRLQLRVCVADTSS